MFSTTEKTSKPATTVNRNAEGASFIGPKLQLKEQTGPPVANTFIQPRLTVSTPGDPYEREADATAEAVMHMPEPATVQAPVQREEERPQRKEDEDRQEENGGAVMTMLQREAAQEEDEKPAVQAWAYGQIIRQEQAANEEDSATSKAIQTKRIPYSTALHRSDVMRQSGRGPPAPSPQFEQTLQQNTSGGNALPPATRQFMESRFGADFGGVRIHTDASAQQMSTDIKAHAFTYGNHIFFNSGKFDTESSGGKQLLAHELTHTIQQGASPVAPSVAPKFQLSFLQRQSALQRATAPQLDTAVTLAKGEQGKVIANKPGPDGNRIGANRLLEYFRTTFGEDKIVKRYTGAPNTVVEDVIKKKSMVNGQVPNQPDPNVQYKRDAMPSWCGIFVFWALNKAGIPMPKWKLGQPMMKPDAAYPGGYTPQPGDIAYRAKNSHYGIVTSVEGGRIRSVNGNTAGADNLGGEIQEQLHEPAQWQGFFNPLTLATGPLTNSTATEQAQQAGTEPARSLRQLRKDKFRAQRKEAGPEEDAPQEEDVVQGKLQLSAWAVGAEGKLQRRQTAHEEEAGDIELKRSAQQQQAEESDRSSDLPVTMRQQNPDLPETERVTELGAVQTKTAASGLHHSLLLRAAAASRIHRYVPAGTRAIQGGWLSDAWDAVSGVISEAAEWVDRGIDAAKDWMLGKVRDFVANIPGYNLLGYILGYDPITGREVPKTPQTLLEAVVQLIPLFGDKIIPVLNYFNATVPVANWLFGAVGQFVSLVQSIGNRFEQLWDRLSLTDIGDPEGVLNRVGDLLRGIVNDVLGFVRSCVSTFLTMVKRIALTNIGQFVQNHFPNAFDLLCVVLGQNPITEAPVARNGASIMNAGLKVLGERGAQIKQQIQENGILQQCVSWIDRAIQVVTDTVSDITNLFSKLWGEINFEALFAPIETFTRIAAHFARPIRHVTSFISDAVIVLLRILKNALLSWLSRTARGMRGYFLITVILGRDVFTREAVERNTENLIHGFMSLMEGGEEQFQQLKQSGTIARTTQKINAAVNRLGFSWAYITGLFTTLWNSFSWNDLLHPVAAFQRILATMASPVRRLINFVIDIIKIVVEVLLVVMNFPSDLVANIFRRIQQVFRTIMRDPIGFLKNLLRAIKQGFVQFFDNILTHLLNGLADWLFMQLGAIGIQRPPDLSLRSIFNLVMQILGISLQQIIDRVWRKLAERIGQERVDKIRRMTDRLEGIWRFLRDVMERGPVAIWEFIQERISNLWDTVIDSIKNWIMERVINTMVARLLSMLDPTGIMAVINSVMAIYRAIQSFIEYLRQMLEIVNSFVNGVAEIAEGNIRVAADYLERTAARFVPIMIGFLANQVGLGRIAGRIVEMIQRVRDMVSRAIDWLIDRAIRIGMPVINGILSVIEGGERLVERGRQAVRNAAAAALGWLGLRRPFTAANGESHTISVEEQNGQMELMIASRKTPFAAKVRAIEIDSNDTAKTTAKREALRIAGEIDTLIKDRRNATISANQQAQKTNQLGGLINTLTIETSKILPPEEAGTNLVVNVDDVIQFKRGEGRSFARVLNVDMNRGLFDFITIGYKSNTTYRMQKLGDLGVTWWRSSQDALELPRAMLERENQSESWTTFAVARSILNWRRSGQQRNRDPGKQWEHMVEHSTGRPNINSSGNLLWTDSVFNQRLNVELGRPNQKQIVRNNQVVAVSLREYLANQPDDEHKRVKEDLYSNYGKQIVSHHVSDDNPRGLWKELT